MGIKIYGSLQSTCTQRVILVLKELGVSFEICEISMQKGEHKDQQFMTDFHPFGRLPVLDDDSTRLFESRAICRYLVAKYGKGSTLDPDHKQRSPSELGSWEQAASIEYSYFDPPMKALSYEKLFKKLMGHGEPDIGEINSQQELLAQTLNLYETTLSGSIYLTGRDFGLIDLYHMPWLRMFASTGLEDEIALRPAVKSWWDRMSGRDSWQNLMSSILGH